MAVCLQCSCCSRWRGSSSGGGGWLRVVRLQPSPFRRFRIGCCRRQCLKKQIQYTPEKTIRKAMREKETNKCCVPGQRASGAAQTTGEWAVSRRWTKRRLQRGALSAFVAASAAASAHPPPASETAPSSEASSLSLLHTYSEPLPETSRMQAPPDLLRFLTGWAYA